MVDRIISSSKARDESAPQRAPLHNTEPEHVSSAKGMLAGAAMGILVWAVVGLIVWLLAACGSGDGFSPPADVVKDTTEQCCKSSS